MYQPYFGLTKPLFESGIAQDAAVFLAPKHEQIIANSRVALSTLDSAVVLTGTAGVGKTTVISAALRTTSTRLALGWITGTPVNGAELLELLLVEFGFNAHRVGRVERMQMWRQFLNEMSATESRVFVIVERADDQSHEVLRALDSLTAADPNGCPGANLVLLGQPVLLEHLKAPVLESLRQRIRLRERLEPLTSDELHAYLTHQVTRVGGAFDKVFAADAVDTLHQLSRGIPRIANNLCETALTLAATREETLLTAESITKIAVAMFGMDSPSAAGEAAAAPASIAPASPAVIVSLEQRLPSVTASFTQPASVVFTPSAPTYAPPTMRAVNESVAVPVASVTPAPFPPVATAAPTFALAPAALPDAAPIVTSSTLFAKPVQDRAEFPAAAQKPSSQPIIPTRTSEPVRMEPEAEAAAIEIDSFADTLTDTPDAQMADLPVLTDAVEPSVRMERPRVRAEMAYARPESAPPSARVPIATPRTPAAASARLPEPVEEDLAHQTQTVRALAAAKSIDDISSSMAETLFGEGDLDMLSAALASAGWSDNAPAPAAPAPKPEPKKTARVAEPKTALEEDPFDLFGLGPDAPLELIDDSAPTDEGGRTAAARR